MEKLKQKLRQQGIKPKSLKRKEPLWGGPEDEGISSSLLGSYIQCKERLRLQGVLGIGAEEKYNHKIEYGNLWHICEEYHGNGESWEQICKRLDDHTRSLQKRHRKDATQIVHWTRLCKLQFPLYLRYWRLNNRKHKRTEGTCLIPEYKFKIPYQLPSGRTVILRGMMDEIQEAKVAGKKKLLLKENKTKGNIKIDQLQRQLQFDLQTGFYISALEQLRDQGVVGNTKMGIHGVLYNVVRRPLSGGKGTIRQKKNQTKDQFYDEVKGIIRDDGDHYFMRWDVPFTNTDIRTYQTRFLNPILEEVCRWWDWVKDKADNPWGKGNDTHWMHPYGMYNVTDEGGDHELDEYLRNGSQVGLVQKSTMFPELE